MPRFLIRPTSHVKCTYIFPLMVFNGQVLWQGECLLPAPLYFPVLRYGENSYVNAVFDYVETQMVSEEEDSND